MGMNEKINPVGAIQYCPTGKLLASFHLLGKKGRAADIRLLSLFCWMIVVR